MTNFIDKPLNFSAKIKVILNVQPLIFCDFYLISNILLILMNLQIR